MSISVSDVIAILALVLSAYTTYRSHKFKAKEAELMKIQEKVNSLVLEKEQREAEQAGRAEIGASFVSIGSNNHRLKIFNKGKVPAHNVTIEFLDDNEVVLESEIKDKFPIEHIDPGQAVELITSVLLCRKRKHALRLKWKDAGGSKREKDVYLTL